MTETDEHLLHPDTGMDAVTLRVGDLEAMSSYYAGAFALTPIAERVRGREVHRVLGRGETPFVRLIHTPDLPRRIRARPGSTTPRFSSTTRPTSQRPSTGRRRSRGHASRAPRTIS